MAMAESLSKWKGIVPLEYFDTLNPDGTNKFSKVSTAAIVIVYYDKAD